MKPPRPFEAPWQSRAFGAAQALRESGALDYEQFRVALIEEIQAGAGSYYEHWQAALERVLAQDGVISPAELADRVGRHDSATRSSHRH